MNPLKLNAAESRDALGQLLADDLVTHLQSCIDQNGHVVLAVSGGSTPKPLFTALQQSSLDWSKIVITLVDERWVPLDHELSNGALVKQTLLDDLPVATFVPLYQPANSVDESLTAVLDSYRAANNGHLSEFDAVVLGMGGDGHTASFFPDADNIEELVSLDHEVPLLTCESPSTQVPRVTWSAPMLLNTSFLALHFCGADKFEVYEQACQSGPITELPIRVAIHQHQTPLNIYYSD